jgi:hypothetical protein
MVFAPAYGLLVASSRCKKANFLTMQARDPNRSGFDEEPQACFSRNCFIWRLLRLLMFCRHHYRNADRVCR